MASEIPRQFDQKGGSQSVRKGTTLETRGRGPCGRSTRVSWGIRYRKVASLPSGWPCHSKRPSEISKAPFVPVGGQGGCNVEHKPYSSACYFDPHRPY